MCMGTWRVTYCSARFVRSALSSSLCLTANTVSTTPHMGEGTAFTGDTRACGTHSAVSSIRMRSEVTVLRRPFNTRWRVSTLFAAGFNRTRMRCFGTNVALSSASGAATVNVFEEHTCKRCV